MKGYLVLETGEVYEGKCFASTSRVGEVVFNTSHSGYQEIATDPSYHNQIVVMTAPMQGNYGINEEALESKKVWIRGFICLQMQQSSRDRTWLDYLQKNQVAVLSDVDTRALTLRLRSGGTPWGVVLTANSKVEAAKLAQQMLAEREIGDLDWVHQASTPEPYKLEGDLPVGPRVAVLDFGSKANILRELKKMSRELIVLPSRTSVADLLAYSPDGVMLTNGPGDPADVKVAVETVKSLVGKKPIFGICMGHQILSLALGAKTYKLKFGHRGANHPIDDQLLGKVYVTSQNHGYAVARDSLPKEIQVSQVNLNDGTVAGIYSDKLKILGIQYHPESCPGPHEARELFNRFAEMML